MKQFAIQANPFCLHSFMTVYFYFTYQFQSLVLTVLLDGYPVVIKYILYSSVHSNLFSRTED